jgi:hypothetical protein
LNHDYWICTSYAHVEADSFGLDVDLPSNSPRICRHFDNLPMLWYTCLMSSQTCGHRTSIARGEAELVRASTVAVVLRQLAAPYNCAELCRPTDANRERPRNRHDKSSLVCEDAAVVLVRRRKGSCDVCSRRWFRHHHLVARMFSDQ